MENKNQLIILGVLGVVLLAAIGYLVLGMGGGSATKANKAGAAAAKDSQARGTRKGARGGTSGVQSETGVGEKELEDVPPFMQYVPFEVKNVYGFRNPMQPLIILEPTPTTDKDPLKDPDTEAEPPPKWCSLTGIIWDHVNPAASVAVFTDPDSKMAVSGGEGEVILPIGADPRQEVILKTIYPSGVMVEYKGNEFNLILQEEEQSYGSSTSRGRSGRRPGRRGGRR